MERFSRAVRRHHRERLKHNRKHYNGGLEFRLDPVGTLSSWADTPCPCSCMGCGNPRKWFGEKTMQERRFECE